MLKIFICEDNNKQKELILKTISDHILIEQLDMEIELVCDNPDDILKYLKENKNIVGLYFLDIDLNHQLSGIDLAAKIREYDSIGKVVFITSRSGLAHLTFKYKIEALDYIVKDDIDKIKTRIYECLHLATDRLVKNNEVIKKFSYKIGSNIRVVDFNKIMFFESSNTPHKIVMHLDNSQVEFYGSIKEIENYDDCLYRCHKSYIINLNNVESIDVSNKTLVLKNQEVCLLSQKALKELLKKIKNRAILKK